MGREHHIITPHPFDLKDMEALARQISKALSINVWCGYEHFEGPLEGLLHPHSTPVRPSWLEGGFVVSYKVQHPGPKATALLYAGDHMFAKLGEKYGKDERVTKGFQEIFGNDAETMAEFYVEEHKDPYICFDLFEGELEGESFGAWIEKGAIQWTTDHFNGWGHFHEVMTHFHGQDDLEQVGRLRQFAFTVAEALDCEKVYYTMGSRGYGPIDTWAETEANLLEKARGEVVDVVDLLKLPKDATGPEEPDISGDANLYVDDFRDLRNPDVYRPRKRLRPLTTFERYTRPEHWPTTLVNDLLRARLGHVQQAYGRIARQKNDLTRCKRVNSMTFIQAMCQARRNETAIRRKLPMVLVDELVPMLVQNPPPPYHRVYQTAQQACRLMDELVHVERSIQNMVPLADHLQLCRSMMCGFTYPVIEEIARFCTELENGNMLRFHPAMGFEFRPRTTDDAQLAQFVLKETGDVSPDERAELKWVGAENIRRARSQDSYLKRIRNAVIGLAQGMLKKAGMVGKKEYCLFEGEVAGYRYYEAADARPFMQHRDRLELRPEPNNPHDPYAIEVFWQDRKLGYVPRTNNRPIHDLLERGETLVARCMMCEEEVHLRSAQYGCTFEILLIV